MNNFKNKPSRIFIISLLLVLTAVAVHAETGKRSLFVVNPGLFGGNYLSGLDNLPAAEQSRPMNSKPIVSSKKFVQEVLAGIAGNVAVGLVVFLAVGDSEGFVPPIAAVGLYSASLCSTALGVYLVGNSGNARGKFGNALLGSLVGFVACWALPHIDIVTYLASAILPPVCAAIFFNSSLRYRDLPVGNGLLNLSEGKLGVGIPDIQVRSVPVYGKNMKTELQFKINLLSVAL